jgi:hypothetical protein
MIPRLLRFGLLAAILSSTAACVIYDDRYAYRDRGWRGYHHHHYDWRGR